MGEFANFAHVEVSIHAPVKGATMSSASTSSAKTFQSTPP